jgi:hypothetical protein
MLKFCLLAALCATPLLAQTTPAVSTFEQSQLPNLLTTYKQIHSHRELSHFEAATSAILAAELTKASYTQATGWILKQS